jgi:hypothetical protein
MGENKPTILWKTCNSERVLDFTQTAVLVIAHQADGRMLTYGGTP